MGRADEQGGAGEEASADLRGGGVCELELWPIAR